MDHRNLGSSARSIASAGSSTSLTTPVANHNVAREREAPLPSTAPSSVPGHSLRGNNEAGADLVHPVSPQQQQRSGATPAPTSDYIVDEDDKNDKDDDETAEAATSCATSAVTIPRAAWAKEGDSILDDVFFEGGNGHVDDNNSAAAAAAGRAPNLGTEEGTAPSPGEDGVGNRSPMPPVRTPNAAVEIMSNLCYGEERCEDGPEYQHQPKRAAFGKASTKV